MANWAWALGGLDFGASAMSSAFNYASAMAANTSNRRIARENRQWLERMANTAHQREVQDLRAAGLNPILSAQGTGASTPSVSTDFRQEAPKIDLGSPGKSILSAAQTASQIDNTDQNTELQKSQARMADSAAALNVQRQASEAFKTKIEAINAEFHRRKTEVGLFKAESEADRAKSVAAREFADTSFRLSDRGSTAFEMKKMLDVYRGLPLYAAPGALAGEFSNIFSTDKPSRRREQYNIGPRGSFEDKIRKGDFVRWW